MQRLDMQTQKKRDNYNKVCVGFSISVLIFAKTVKQLQIEKTKLNKKTDGIVVLDNRRFTHLILN